VFYAGFLVFYDGHSTRLLTSEIVTYQISRRERLSVKISAGNHLVLLSFTTAVSVFPAVSMLNAYHFLKV
jgi:hypothetical protein